MAAKALWNDKEHRITLAYPTPRHERDAFIIQSSRRRKYTRGTDKFEGNAVDLFERSDKFRTIQEKKTKQVSTSTQTMVERSISRSRGLLCDESQNLYRLLPSADIWSYAQRMYLRPTNMQTKLHRILFQFISFYLFVSLTCRVRMRGRAPTVRPTEFQTCLRSAWR